MRYYRFVLHPQSPAAHNGGVVSLRMRFALTDQMIYATLRDGDLCAVPDEDMGQWGGPTDALTDIDGPDGPYLLWQETAPQLPDLGAVPLWSSQLRAYDASPEVQPTVWPAVGVVVGPA